MAVKFTNNAKTTLASGITSSATSATVTDGSVFPSLSSGEHFYCTFDDGTNNEIVKVTARSGNTLTIVRAADNTTARAFSSGNQAELRATAALLTDIQENIAAKSANQTVYNTTTASSATTYDVGTDPGVEGNAMVFLNGVLQHHDTISFSGSTLTFDAAPPNGMALEVIIDNLINLQSSNLTVDTFTAADVSGSPQTDFTLSDTPAAEQNLIVFVDGVFQAQDAYTISNEVLTMTDGVTAGLDVTVYVINPVNIGTPSDSTVTSAKLSGDITTPGAFTVSGAFTSQGIDDNADATAITISSDENVTFTSNVVIPADLTVDTSTLKVDSTNNRVGVGTNSPSANAKLDVNGVIKLYNASSNPTAVEGGIYYNTTDDQVKVSNGTTWYPIGESVLPSAVSNLYSWWDLSGTFSTIGSGNSTVSDASGNGYTLTEVGTVTTEIFPSGKSGMRTGASGAGNYFTSSAVPATTGARTLFAIIYNLKNTAVAYQHIMHYGTSSTSQAFGIAFYSAGYLSQHIWSGNGATTSSYTAGRTGGEGITVIFSIYDGSSTAKLRVYDAGGNSGVTSSATVSSLTTGSSYGIHVGGRINGPAETGDVVIGECGAYSKELSESEMDNIASGLLNRWT